MLGKMSILLEILTTVQNFDFIFFMQNIIYFVFFFFVCIITQTWDWPLNFLKYRFPITMNKDFTAWCKWRSFLNTLFSLVI